MSTQPNMPTPDTPQLLLEHHLKALWLPTTFQTSGHAHWQVGGLFS